MLYFDKEKSKFVWFHIETGKSGIDQLREKTTHYCLIDVPGTIYTKEEAEIFKQHMKKNDVFVYIPASVPNNTEERMRWALNYLNSQEAKDQGCAIKHKYDYYWIKMVIDKNLFPGAKIIASKSIPQYIKFLESLGIPNQDLPDKTLFSNYKIKFRGENCYLPWDYEDCPNDREEKNRRNNIAMTFLGIMSNICL